MRKRQFVYLGLLFLCISSSILGHSAPPKKLNYSYLERDSEAAVQRDLNFVLDSLDKKTYLKKKKINRSKLKASLKNEFLIYQQAFHYYKKNETQMFLDKLSHLKRLNPQSSFIPNIIYLDAKRLFWNQRITLSLKRVNQILSQFKKTDIKKEALYLKIQIYNKLKIQTSLINTLKMLKKDFMYSSEYERAAFEFGKKVKI